MDATGIALASDSNGTAEVGLDAIGKGGFLALISDHFAVFLIIFVSILLLILIPIIIRYKKQKPSKLELKLAELQQERQKFELMSRRMLREELNGSKLVLNPTEQQSLESYNLDNSILARKVLFKMNEVEARTRRLELGAAGEQLSDTIDTIKDQERSIFGRNRL